MVILCVFPLKGTDICFSSMSTSLIRGLLKDMIMMPLIGSISLYWIRFL